MNAFIGLLTWTAEEAGERSVTLLIREGVYRSGRDLSSCRCRCMGLSSCRCRGLSSSCREGGRCSRVGAERPLLESVTLASCLEDISMESSSLPGVAANTRSRRWQKKNTSFLF